MWPPKHQDSFNFPVESRSAGTSPLESVITEREVIRLFLRHETELRAFATTLMLRHEDAEDVLQEACVSMWQKIANLEGSDSFRAWAYTFVRFTALNRIRKRNRSPLLFSEKLLTLLAEEGMEESDRSEAELEALSGCLDKLPANQLNLIQRYYSSTKVHMAELAIELKKNTAGLYKTLERARESLRTCISRRLHDQGFQDGPSQ